MLKIFPVFNLFTLLFYSTICNGQLNEKDKLKLAVRCHDTHYIVDYGEFPVNPIFILGLQNTSSKEIDISDQIIFGHDGDTLHLNNVTFQLYYIAGKDTVNVLKNILSVKSYPHQAAKKITLIPDERYLFEFHELYSMYFKKSGKYMIRFTLLKKYAPNYLINNISTEWVYFDVEVPEQHKKQL